MRAGVPEIAEMGGTGWEALLSTVTDDFMLDGLEIETDDGFLVASPNVDEQTMTLASRDHQRNAVFLFLSMEDCRQLGAFLIAQAGEVGCR